MRRPIRILSDVSETSGATDAVCRLVVERAVACSQPGRRTDGARLALAIEGGGMAGAVSGGMCVALEALGLISSFDVIYGSSSGALNASYTAAGQARSHAGLYPQAAASRLIDPRRMLLGRPPFRLAALVNHLLDAHPHDERVLHAQPELRVTATRWRDKGPGVLADFSSIDEVRQAVWASCAIPILAHDVVEFRGEQYVDGALTEPLPYRVALSEGATHVLVLRTRHAGHRCRGYSPPATHAIHRLLRDAPETLAELMCEHPARYNAEARALQSGALIGRVCQMAPPIDARVMSQLEWRPSRLVEGLRIGMRTVQHALAPYLASALRTRVDTAAELPAA